MSAVIDGLSFAARGLINMVRWIRRRQHLPRYVHVLAGVAILLGLWMGTLDGGTPWTIAGRVLLYAAIMVALVYVSFGFYGTAVMGRRAPPAQPAITPSWHRARITWSTEQVRQGLPSFEETTDPAWFGDGRDAGSAWSIRCRFPTPPSEQGNPSLADVMFAFDEAPHHQLIPGASLHLFERGSGHHAVLTILS